MYVLFLGGSYGGVFENINISYSIKGFAVFCFL
jgi:hypothetical protein